MIDSVSTQYANIWREIDLSSKGEGYLSDWLIVKDLHVKSIKKNILLYGGFFQLMFKESIKKEEVINGLIQKLYSAPSSKYLHNLRKRVMQNMRYTTTNFSEECKKIIGTSVKEYKTHSLETRTQMLEVISFAEPLKRYHELAKMFCLEEFFLEPDLFLQTY